MQPPDVNAWCKVPKALSRTPIGILKMPLTDLACKLEMTISGVGYAAQRGEDIALRHNFHLLE